MPGWQTMMRCPILITLVLAALWLAGGGTAAAQINPDDPTATDAGRTAGQQTGQAGQRDDLIRQRLAIRFLRSARQAAATNPLTVQAMDAAIILIEQAAELDPDNQDIWRVARRLGVLAEDDSLRRHAVRKLIELGVDDHTIVLARLEDVIDQYQTVDRRRDMYAKLLDEKTRARLPAPVASELAMDYALLLRLVGDNESFADWLARAVLLDPSNAIAASTAAGYFINNVEDPYGEAELLLNLVRANITDVDAQTALAQLLLEHGAYRGARRMYELAADSAWFAGSALPTERLADVAIAQWASGDSDRALETIHRRQTQRNNIERAQLASQNPDLPSDELAQHTANLAPAAAAVRAAIHHRQGVQWGSGEPGADALARAQQTYEAVVQQIDGRLDEIQKYLKSNTTQAAPQDNWFEPDGNGSQQGDADDAQATQPATQPDTQPATQQQSRAERVRAQLLSAKAQLLLEKAWLTVWLDGSPQTVAATLEQVNGLRPLSKSAQQRFDGWLALNRGEITRAIELLEPLAEDDPAAGLGSGMALLADDQRRRAAELLLNVARDRTGTLMGVYAADVLQDVLGRRVPLTDLAKRLESLIDAVPRTVDRYPRDPRLAVSMRVEPAQSTFGPFEPVVIHVELTNNASFPLGIRPAGPIEPQVALVASAQIVGDSAPMDRKPLVIEIDRQLRLMPGERMTVPVNLREYHVGREIERNLLYGAILHLRAISNFRMVQSQTLEPGLLGVEVASRRIRVNGARISDEWLSAAIDAISEPDSTDDLEQIVMVCHATAGDRRLDPRLIEQARALIPQAYETLNDLQRAWILAAVPSEAIPAEIIRSARQDTATLTRMSYLANKTYGVDDPALIAALNADDPRIKQLAQWARQYVLQLEQQSAQ